MLFKKKSPLEKRRFQRLPIHDPKLVPVEMQWSDGESLSVFDLSHKGAAVAAPKEAGLPGEILNVSLKLGQEVIGPISVRIAWKREGVWGLEFYHLPGSDRLALNSFLEHKLIGANLKAVDHKYFSPDLDCAHWYHGPNETDLFLWTMDNGETKWIARAVFELPEIRVVYNKGTWSQEEKSGREFSDDLTPLPPKPSSVSLRDRLIDLLTQLVDSVPGVRELIEKLKTTSAFDD